MTCQTDQEKCPACGPRPMQIFQNAACQDRQRDNERVELASLRLEVAAWRALTEYGVAGHWMPPRDLGVGSWATTGSRNTDKTELPEYPTFGHGDTPQAAAIDLARKLQLIPAEPDESREGRER